MARRLVGMAEPPQVEPYGPMVSEIVRRLSERDCTLSGAQWHHLIRGLAHHRSSVLRYGGPLTGLLAPSVVGRMLMESNPYTAMELLASQMSNPYRSQLRWAIRDFVTRDRWVQEAIEDVDAADQPSQSDFEDDLSHMTTEELEALLFGEDGGFEQGASGTDRVHRDRHGSTGSHAGFGESPPFGGMANGADGHRGMGRGPGMGGGHGGMAAGGLGAGLGAASGAGRFARSRSAPNSGARMRELGGPDGYGQEAGYHDELGYGAVPGQYGDEDRIGGAGAGDNGHGSEAGWGGEADRGIAGGLAPTSSSRSTPRLRTAPESWNGSDRSKRRRREPV